MRTLILSLLLAIATTAMSDNLVVGDIVISPGEQQKVSVSLDNPTKDYIMIEFWLSLPEGMTIPQDEDGYLMAYGNDERFRRTHILEAAEQNGAYHFLIYSSRNEAFKGSSGELFNFTIQVDDDMLPGTYTGKIFNQLYNDSDKNEYSPSDVTFNLTVGQNPPEAYAVVTKDSEGATLTFYYDELRHQREGKTYDLNDVGEWPNWGFNFWGESNKGQFNTHQVNSLRSRYKKKLKLDDFDEDEDEEDKDYDIKNVVFDPSFSDARPKSTYAWFSDMQLDSLEGLEYLNTSLVEDMNSMFAFSNISNIDLSHFDTSKVEDMGSMFEGCQNLKSIDLSHFDTSEVVDMSRMFFGCQSLESIDLSHFDTSEVEDMIAMFAYCESLTELDLSHFNIPTEGDDMSPTTELLSGCSGLRKLTISSSMTDLSEDACEGVGTTDSPCVILAPEGFDFGEDTDSSSGAFEWKGGIFFIERNLPEGPLAYTVLSDDGTLTFYYDENFKYRVGSIHYLNFNMSFFPDEDYIPFEGEVTAQPEDVKKVVFDPSFAQAAPTSTRFWFRGMSQLANIEGIEYLNTSEVGDMAYMFYGCQSLDSIDLLHFDTSNVIDDEYWSGGADIRGMQYMFAGCSKLKSLDLTNFDTSSVGNMESMFQGCSELTSLDVSHFDTSNVYNMGFMFEGCRKLKNLDVSNFQTHNVRCDYLWRHLMTGDVPGSYGFVDMFAGCESLEHLDVSHFDISKAGNLSGMFNNCSSLKTVKIFSFENDKVEEEDEEDEEDEKPYYDFDTYAMFDGCSSLTEIDLSGVKAVVNNAELMFNNCINLKKLDISNLQVRVAEDLNDSYKWFGYENSIVRMFNNCKSLTELDLGHFNIPTEYVFNSDEGDDISPTTKLLAGCSGLRKLTISSSMTDLSEDACEGVGTTDCPCVILVPEGSYYGEYTDTLSGFFEWFEWKGGVFIFYLPEELAYTVLSDNGTLTFYYDENFKYRVGSIHYLNFNMSFFPEDYIPFEGEVTAQSEDVKKVVFDPSFAQMAPTSTRSWFSGMSQLANIEGIEYLNTSEVGDMAYMFYGCQSLDSIDLSHFDTSKVIDEEYWKEWWPPFRRGMQYMFAGCSKLKSLDLTHFDTSSVGNMESMFQGCSELTSLDVSHFDTSNVYNMGSMFEGCQKLKKLDVSNINTQNVHYDYPWPGLANPSKGLVCMFAGCESLEHLDVSHFDISNAGDLSGMFYNCSSLKTV